MPLRPIARKHTSGNITNKKYSGVLERYRASDGVCTGYYISYRDADSKAQKHAVEAENRDDALLQLNQIKAQVKRDKLRNERSTTKHKSYTIDELADEFFDAKSDNINNIKEEQRYKNHLKDRIGSKKASDLLPKDIEEIQKSMTLAPKSINLATDLLRSILNYAHKNRMTKNEDYRMDGYTKLHVDNQVEKILSPDEVRTLIHGIRKPRLKLFVTMAYFTAQRPLSLLRLQVKDTRDGWINIAGIKKQKGHRIKVHTEIAPLLGAWIRDNDLEDDDYIFFGVERGKTRPLSYERIQVEASELFEPFNEGLDYKEDRSKWTSLYTLRHSAATQILRVTGSLDKTASVLNHSDSRVTRKYAQILDEQKSEAIDVL